MSPEKVRKIFDPARVAASAPLAVRSTGFGLYLTRLLVESHGGKISCRSEEGKGTTLTVELPIS
jgi:signal transduction histidine kinase